MTNEQVEKCKGEEKRPKFCSYKNPYLDGIGKNRSSSLGYMVAPWEVTHATRNWSASFCAGSLHCGFHANQWDENGLRPAGFKFHMMEELDNSAFLDYLKPIMQALHGIGRKLKCADFIWDAFHAIRRC
jgi:hypothetical protein